jgi:GNAT superfamily N-acetyltransferase
VKNGYEAFLAFRHDEPIGYWWWVTRDTAPRVTHPSLERFGLTLKYDELFAFDFFIAPEHRVNGTAVKFLSLIYEELVRAGYRVVWGSVDASNMRARWVYNVLGNKVAWRNTAYELFGYVLLQDRRIFVRNTRWATPHSFDRRLLFRLAPRAAGPLTDPASLSESATSART